MPKIPLWLSPHKAYYKKEMRVRQKCLRYVDLLEYSTDDIKLKSRKYLALESLSCQWYLQVTERFKVDKKLYNFEHDKTIFEMELCTNEEHLISKIYKLLLKLETKDKLVKICMISWGK